MKHDVAESQISGTLEYTILASQLIFNNVIKCQLIKLILRKQQQK